jgi:hypothetical protein
MNHNSLRASPGGSSALSRHCTSRSVFVNEPSFSTCAAAGMRKTSVSMSSVRSSPDRTSGLSRQNVADSISAKSRTTSHFRFASARRMRPECWEPTAGFWPMRSRPSSPPSIARSIVGKWAWLPEILGRAAKPKSLSGVAASPYHALSSETMYFGKFDHQPRDASPDLTYASSVSSSSCARGMCR